MQLSGRVCVTGGAGFLARAIYRRARQEKWDVQFTCVSRDDAKHAALSQKYPEVICVRGDVADRDSLTAVFAGHDTVIHAAANKHVDRAETNVLETIRTNIDGSVNVVWAALRSGVKDVLGISTDKATGPSVYGLTKRVMECAFEEGNRIGDTRFVLTRYGNVVASTGSVLPVFRSQLAQFGEVRVTDPAMTRFWMRADEAVDCVLLALDPETPRGWIVVPFCGAMELGTLVALVAKPSEIRIVGLRAGERMDETLITDLESVRAVPVRDTNAWRMAPFAQISGSLPNTWHYSSDRPQSWWTGEQMLAAIADSEQV